VDDKGQKKKGFEMAQRRWDHHGRHVLLRITRKENPNGTYGNT
jgi:hypothetical protein